ncbi:hypothetical protein FJZ22_02945 [Candidatus Pacearchaeota archaeon]|nr:hypothetical protein [Candidatus Pacearchaeota archaeon]
MGIFQTLCSLLMTAAIILTLTCATLGFATQTILAEKTQNQALISSGLLTGIVRELSAQTNITIPEGVVTTLVLKNVPRITAYLADTSPTLDFDLSLPETEFTSLFGTMPPCQKEQNPLQNGKINCKPTAPFNVLSQSTTNALDHTTQQTESEVNNGFSQAKQVIKLLKIITWITFFLALAVLLSLIGLNHASWPSALSWATVALCCAGFLTLAIALLSLNHLSSFLPSTPLFLNAYLTSLLTAVLAKLKIYSLTILGTALLALFGAFYLKSK